MFRKTSPQTSMFESQFLLPPEKAARLKKSWAEPFRTKVLGLIDEELFRDAFSDETGRPNTSIQLLVGLHLLKEWNNLTDEQVLEHFEFNLQWHYALAVEPAVAHVSQKTLHNFRQKLMANERAQRMFEAVTRGLAQLDGLRIGVQRLDSTHVLPNIAVLTRLGLFVETVVVFLKELQREHPEDLRAVPVGFIRRYLEREGYFSDAKRSQAPRRLQVVVQDVLWLLTCFAGQEAITMLPGYQLLRRLFDEQCEVDESDEPDVGSDDDDDEGNGTSLGTGQRTRARLREPKDIGGNSLQTPHDPDATYGHKGKGYEVQVAETCDEENPYQLITGVSVNGANESDQAAVIPMLEQLEASGLKPTELLADTGYGSGHNIVESARRDVELIAPVRDPDAAARTDHFLLPAAETTRSQAEPPSAPLGLGHFSFDADLQAVLYCPGGQVPASQHTSNGQLHVTFAAAGCEGCPFAEACPLRRLANGDRQLNRSPAHIATEVRQLEQRQPHFKERYRARSGIEPTNQELKGRHGLGDLRVRGKERVTLAALLKALALNVKRAAHHAMQTVLDAMSAEPCAA